MVSCRLIGFCILYHFPTVVKAKIKRSSHCVNQSTRAIVLSLHATLKHKSQNTLSTHTLDDNTHCA